ncbi:MAG: c-type cytochrome [Cyclobacteriaceae bacterium]|nr:c-type cytochrome [Cyclobacteriaceae bacterium]
MEIGMRHLHVTVVIVFLLFMIFKTVLLLANKLELLDRIRSKTKVADMILGLLIVVTGIYMMTLKSGIESYLWIKLILVILAIPLGIVGLKRHKKLLALLSVLIIVYIYGIAEAQSYKFKRDHIEISNSGDVGKQVYTKLCVDCHGEDGKKGLYKAPDLTTSALNDEEKTLRIQQGKGLMRGYESELDQQQIEALLEYLNAL